LKYLQKLELEAFFAVFSNKFILQFAYYTQVQGFPRPFSLIIYTSTCVSGYRGSM